MSSGEHGSSVAPAHVAFYVPTLNVGGAQRVTITTANGLAEAGYDVDVVLSYDRGDLAGTVSEDVRLLTLDTPRVPGLGIGASVPQLRSYLRSAEPDVLFSAMTFATVVTLASAARLDVPVVAIEHTVFGRNLTPKDRVVTWLARQWYDRTDHVFGVSRGVTESVVENTGLSQADVSVQYNPVDVESIRRQSREPVSHPAFDGGETILSVGRLDAPKDHATLVEAFAAVTDRRPGAQLVIAGTGPDRDDLLSLAESLGVRADVWLPGYVENPYRYMQRASVFALSSRYEGLPTVLIEALATGCPVVATDCPHGPREILSDGAYGRLVPVGDADALADALVETLETPPADGPLRARADDFAADAVLEEYVAFIDGRAR